MQILFFILYTCIFIISFKYIFSNQSQEITYQQAIIIFLLKTLVGCLYGLLFFNYYNSFNNDTWHYNNAALYEYKILLNKPNIFFDNLFSNRNMNDNYLGFFDTTNNFWKDLQKNIVIKLLVIFNLFSRGNYYVNTLFFNFITFWGHYYFFKLLMFFYSKKKAINFLIAFLFPPLLFWESGISKDGLVFLGIAGFLYYFVAFLVRKQLITLIKAIIFFLLIALIRNFVALSIIPVITACALSYRLKSIKSIYVYLIAISAFIVLFSVSSYLGDKFNLPLKMAERQEAFQKLEGGSYMFLPILKATFMSYVKVLPYAFNHTFFRPYLFEAKSIFLFCASLESLSILALLFFSLLQIKRLKTIAEHPFLMLLLFLALLNYLMIGYTVPFAGAIVRYRVFFEAMLLLPMLIICDSNNKLEDWLNKVLRLY